jgi:hypothetical protein
MVTPKKSLQKTEKWDEEAMQTRTFIRHERPNFIENQ